MYILNWTKEGQTKRKPSSDQLWSRNLRFQLSGLAMQDLEIKILEAIKVGIRIRHASEYKYEYASER